MAITFDAASNGAGASASNTATWSHTVGAGSNGILYVLGGFGKSGDSSTMTVDYGGAAMTSIGSQIHTNGSNGGYIQFFYLLAPTAGTATVTVTVTTTGTRTVFGSSISLLGVDQTTPHNGPTTATGDSNSASVTRASSTGNLILYGYGAGATMQTGNRTERFKLDNSSSFACGNTYGQTTAGAASVTGSCTVNGGGDFWAAIALDIVAAGAATKSFPFPSHRHPPILMRKGT